MTVEHEDLEIIEYRRDPREVLRSIFNSPSVLPIALLVANIVLGLGLYLVAEPLRSGVEKERTALKRAVREIRSALSGSRAELDSMAENPERYRELIERGLINPQDRLAASNIMDRLRNEMGLYRIQYEIDPERGVDTREYSRRGFTVVATTVRLTARGETDGDFIRFIEAVRRELPGHVKLLTLNLDREVDNMDAAVNAIRADRPFAMVTARAEFEWRTLMTYVKKKAP